MCAANGLHEDADGFDTCNGTCDADEYQPRCGRCDEVVCCCDEDETVETAALDVPAVSEAEAVRRQFRDELLGLLDRAIEARRRNCVNAWAAEAGTFEAGVEEMLRRHCGMTVAQVAAVRGGL